jgi:hypothetical protein
MADAEASDDLLQFWGHYLGACNRPFGRQDWILTLESMPIAVATSSSIVGTTAAGYPMQDVVELARLCTSPDHSWATRVILRLWREIGARRWPYWPIRAAVAYSQNNRHDGAIYRFDGWEKVTEKAGSSGGGTYSRKRFPGDAADGKKTLWLWRFGA